MKLEKQLARQAKAAKHGRQTKWERSKYDSLRELEEKTDQGFISLWDALQLAFNHGYELGYTPDPLYNMQGQQIREVTQAELDWSH